MQPGALEGALHQCALFSIQRHRFLDAAMLARRSRQQAVFQMAVRWRSDVHRIHFGVIDQCLGIRVGPGNPVACRIIAHRFLAPPHHGHQRRAWCFVESGSTLDFSNTATTDHAPADGAHLTFLHQYSFSRAVSVFSCAVSSLPYKDPA